MLDVVDRGRFYGHKQGGPIGLLDGEFEVRGCFTQVCVVVAWFEGEVKTHGSVGKSIVCGFGYEQGLQNNFLGDGDGV